jgi:hypothetical protein
MLIAHLSSERSPAFEQIQTAFARNNPGYQLRYLSDTRHIDQRGQQQIAFVQEGGGTLSLSTGDTSKISVGDIVLLDPEVHAETDSLISYLIFEAPEIAPDNIPRIIRPDWDPNITDTPGGCATETNAYRRILLTWLGKVGPYNYKSLNAHRVRIMNSFTHYHPKEGGFDEFYLVQMVLPEARIITSEQTNQIVDTQHQFTRMEAEELLQETKLQVGDLVYLPRGVIHRGIGGVLTQVITVPGFVPGAEIGVDHHLRRISEGLGLTGDDRLPFHEDASMEAVIK